MGRMSRVMALTLLQKTQGSYYSNLFKRPCYLQCQGLPTVISMNSAILI